MSYTDDFLKGLQKRNVRTDSITPTSGADDFTNEFLSSLEKRKKRKDASLMDSDFAPTVQIDNDDVAPVKSASTDPEERSWFEKGAFSDGWQFGDLTKTILGTGQDVSENALAGIIGMGEKIVDTGAHVAGMVGGLVGADKFQRDMKGFIKKDLYDEKEIAQSMTKLTVANLLGGADNSVLGEKSDSIVQSAGQLLGTTALQAVGVPWYLTTGVTSFGGESENAFKKGASFDEATISSAITAGAEILTEKISGGISFGGKTLDDSLVKEIGRNISDKTARTLVKLGVDATGEGFEEILSGVMSAIGQKVTYEKEKDFNELFSGEDAFESFVGGFVLGGGGSSINAIKSNAAGVDSVTGLKQTEQSVVDKVYQDKVAEREKDGKLSEKEKREVYDSVLNDFEKGYITTDTIEEVLGGETYKSYSDARKSEESLQAEYDSVKKEYDALRSMKHGDKSDVDVERQAELEKRLNTLKPQVDALKEGAQSGSLKAKLGDEVFNLVKDTRLAESYNERARRGQAFQADLSKYDAKQQAVIKKAVDSGILNNTNRTHEFVDLVAKISADKGVLFDFTNNAKLKESGFAVDGKFVNGFVTKDGVTVNIQSSKSLNSVVGHEITHVLEGTELYTELQNAVKQYAESKGDYQSRLDVITKLYDGVDGADVNAEITADLVGDYLFTDADFVKKLSVENRNVFQKIFDEIKYLAKVATAGSKEARQLVKAKKAFEEAYRESGKGVSGKKYALESKTQPGRLDPRTVTKKDVFELLSKVEDGTIYGNTYIPVRISTPSKLIYWAEKRRGDVIDNNPIAISADKAYNAMNREGETESGRVNMLSPDEVVSMIEGMNDPRYIVYQGANDRYVEVVEFDTKTGDKAFAVIEIGNNKDAVYMNGYEGGLYNILVTTYPPKAGKLKELLNNKNNQVIYDKTKDASQRTSSSTVPSVLNDASFYEDSLPENPKDVKKQYSLTSDSEGHKLSEEQQEFFKDTKVVDADGNLQVVYHGTYEDFTVFDISKTASANVFGKGHYFTSKKGDAQNNYASGSGADVRTKIESLAWVYFEEMGYTEADYETNEATDAWNAAYDKAEEFYKNGHVVQAYLNLKNPVYARGSELYDANGNFVSARSAEYLKELGYDGIIDYEASDRFGDFQDLDEDTVHYVVFDSNQIKLTTNTQPTGDSDIRFSLSETVEESGDLMALHNVFADKLMDALRLGGLPSPSVAITKSDIEHSNYGEISLVLPKEAIDPQVDSRNKVYGSDAWTPTRHNARTEYEVDGGKMRAFEKRIAELSKKTAGGAFVSDSTVRRMGVDDATTESASRLAERMANYDEVRAAYLADNGITVEPEYKTKQFNEYGNASLQKYIDQIGVQHLASLVADAELGNMETIRAEADAVRQIMRNWFAEKNAYSLNKRPDLKELRINAYMKNRVSMFTIEDFVRDAWEYYQDGGTVTEEIDRLATSDKVRNAVNNDDVKAWLEPQIAEFLGKPGIYNGTDLFTRDGTRRSFEETHFSYTAENIVKAMQMASARGAGTFGANANSIIATATPSYNSIEEMHADEGRLRVEDKEAYDKILADIDERLNVIEHDIMRTTEHHADNTFDEEQIIGSIITEAATGARTIAAIQKVFAKEDYRISAEQAQRILELYNEVATVPTGYFEAKPERVVGFEEVAVFVIPRNADVKLKQELLNRGYSIAEYDPDVEGDRQKVVNQFEEYKFSLSNVGETSKTYGNYNVYGRDVALETEEEIAPVDETAPVQETAPAVVAETEEDMFPDDYAPMTDEEAATLQEDTLANLADEDAPPVTEPTYSEIADSITVDQKPLKQLAKGIGETLGLNRAGKAELEQVMQGFSRNEYATKEELYDEMEKHFGTYNEEVRNDEIAYAKSYIRQAKIKVSQSVKSEFGGAKDYAAFMRSNFGKIRFSNEGVGADQVYMQLNELHPGLFPDTITNPADQLRRIAEVANQPAKELIPTKLPEEMIQDATDMIYDSIAEYKEAERMVAAENTHRENFVNLWRHADEYAPPVEEDIAPVAETPIAETPAPPVAETPADTFDPYKPLLTVKDRLAAKLHNTQTEIATNQEMRQNSREMYDKEIARLYEEYDAKANHNTKAAQDLLRRAAQMQTRRDNVDADYVKRINDLEAKREKQAAELRSGESTTEQGAMRAELHTRIVDDVKTAFYESGYDFDEVLESAKDLSTFKTVDNTPQRVMEKTFGYEEGQILADLTVNRVAQHETEGIQWLNSFTDRKNGLIAQISKQYGIRPGSKESAAAQMYAEGFYETKNGDLVAYGDAELAKDFPDATVQANIKGLARDGRIRQIYDETLRKINESRARNAYPEIQRLDNYFLHFRAMSDTFSKLGIPFNPNDIRAKDLPTDLNGVTADLKPGQPYFASAMHRMGKRTSFDLLGGLEMYLTSAKDQIYHIDDIQTLRALRNYIADTYGQAKGLEGLDVLTEEEAQKKIEDVYKGHLSNFAKFLNEEANAIAGKTSLTDRGIEGVIGRRGITFLGDLNKQVGSNMVGFNVSSSMTNFLSVVQAFAKTNKFDFVKAMAQTAASKIGSVAGKSDGFAESSPVIIRRKGAERFHRTAWQKASDAGYFLMGAVDNISTEIIARAKYNELTRKGMDSEQAHIETDKWVSRLMGDRSLGQQPLLYNSKMLGMLTKFQLEVRNQLDSQFYDTIQEAKVSTKEIENGLQRNALKAAKVTSTFFQLAVLQHLFGKAFESVAGYNPSFDIIEALIKTFGWDDEEDDEDTALDNIQEGFLELLGDLPYTSTFTGGRIPISSALPIEQFVTGKDQYGNEKSRLDTIKEAAPYYVLPGGYGQAKKTMQGLSMFDDEHPVAGSYTDSGNLRFPVEDTLGNRVQAGVFGQWASENARDYFDNERAPLKEKQIQEFIDLDLPIKEYWDYREGLKDLDTVEEKLDYIDSLDLPFSKKNIMANNVTDRKEPIDLTDYADYGSLEEFDFATKNPEKYEFFESNGLSYKAYSEGDEDTKEAYTWAFNNPEKFTVSKVVAGDVVEYRKYAKELNKITADRDAYDKPISGSAKNKKIEYINGLDLDYGAKAILFKSQYKTDDTYNNEIVEYLNGREDISTEEIVTILKELDFTVTDDGTVYW